MKNYVLAVILLLIAGCSGNFDSNNHAASKQIEVMVVMSLDVKGDGKYTNFIDSLSVPLDRHSGKIVREFKVVGKANGSINFGPVNRVVVLKFSTNQDSIQFLKNSTIKGLIRNSGRNKLKIMTGKILSSLSARGGELYILKISNYKSNDGQAQRVADKINLELKRKYGFHLDFTANIVSVKNIRRADEVAVFLYTKATNQKQLYKDKDIMKQIGDFNKKYLDEFVYLALKPLGK